MAADDLVLDMIKTHSRYDVPEDITLSCHDVPECSDFARGIRRSSRPVEPVKPIEKEVNGSLKDANSSDWPGEQTEQTDWPTESSEIPDWSKQKIDSFADFKERAFLDTWEYEGTRCNLSNEESTDNRTTDEEELNSHGTSQKDPGNHVSDQKDPANHLIGQDATTDNATLKFKGDGSQSELRTSGIGRPVVEVEDDWWDGEGRPTGERWPPLGASDDRVEDGCSYDSWYRQGRSCEGDDGVGAAERERLRQLEEEQDQLSNSLMALTSHFAQVQFRLKQIVHASPEQKEELLSQLEEFANRGIPDMRAPSAVGVAGKEGTEGDGEQTDSMSTMEKQKELISQLKQQLDDLELYVYETGEGGPPQAQVMERQRVIIEQLKDRLNLNVDETDKLTLEDLRQQVDRNVRELINPLKMKEQLVAQLQTQISDLERFIDFLQGEGGGVRGARLPPRPMTTPPKAAASGGDARSQEKRSRAEQKKEQHKSEAEQLRRETASVVERATTLLNMLSFGCGENGRTKFRRNTLKKTPQGSHYGDIRAALELAVVQVEESIRPDPCGDSDQTSDSEAEVEGEEGNVGLGARAEVTMAVRKHLTPALRDLMQHGLMPVGQSQSLVPFLSCLPHPPSHRPSKLMHAWDLILQYYHLKKGHQYNRTPARRLSQSFNLEITGGGVVTNKQSLLGVIGSIISTHTPLKRSFDSHLKAFVSSALNQKKLVVWLRLIFRTQALMEQFYQPWSYASLTGFEDALRSLDRLTPHNFRLPVDLAVRPFQNMRDAF